MASGCNESNSNKTDTNNDIEVYTLTDNLLPPSKPARNYKSVSNIIEPLKVISISVVDV